VLQDEFRAALEAGDVQRLRKMWSVAAPHLPQPTSDAEAEVVMHRARTESETVSLKARAWSHRWLSERNLPSGLPDMLKPSAERMYPRVVEGVGLSINCRNPYFKPAMIEVRQAMEGVVEDCYANGDTDPAIVRPRMAQAREKVMRQLFGRPPALG
jgi:hypothetical protein